MTDHHDFPADDHSFDHDPLPWDDGAHDLPVDFHLHEPDVDDAHADAGQFDPAQFDAGHFDTAHAGHPEPFDLPEHPEPVDHAQADIPDVSDPPGEEVFPPPMDVGPLPEPVDGFPWIDSGSLGLADIAAALHDQDHTDPVRPEELAEYAGTDLPPGQDPWAVLADSDDPATAALAKWWQEN